MQIAVAAVVFDQEKAHISENDSLWDYFLFYWVDFWSAIPSVAWDPMKADRERIRNWAGHYRTDFFLQFSAFK